MLVDGAKYGDVEIPVFCYEPKLGQPVGACRMCLVEIEGIPKLQTACSTPVKDGMVVHTQTERVHDAQRAVVEFLLINHPLDCPVCDKGGECPLQDITYGWGPGTSRFIEPKRHFQKPLELSPLIAIDRERCILCYRCVRFSQEISEDYQLILLERGAHSFVGTFDGHPYVAPVQRQHRRAVPGRRAHVERLPLPRAPVGHRGRRLDLHALPRAVQRRVHRPRRARHARARPRPRRGRRRLAVRQGPLRLPARPRRRAHHRAARARGRGADARELGEGAGRRGGALAKAGGRAAALAAGETTNEEAFLLAAAVPRGPRLGPPRRARRAASCRSTSRARSPTPRCRRPSRTSSSPTPSCCSTATRSTTRRSSTCASARACAATACASPSPPRGRPRSTRAPTSSCASRRAPARRCSSRSTPRSPATTATSAAPRPPPARTPTASAPSPRR